MSVSSESSGTNQDSFLTDEVLQEVIDYEVRQRSQHRRYTVEEEDVGEDWYHEENGDGQFSGPPQRSQHSRGFDDDDDDGYFEPHRSSHHSRRYKIESEELNDDDENNELSNRRSHTRAQHEIDLNGDLTYKENESVTGTLYSPSNVDYTANQPLYLGESSGKQRLCWRSDPSESLSDWTIQIFNRSSKTYDTYHVHRVVMALGPRGCEFFQDVFRKADSDALPHEKVTRVPLIAESCTLVGCFLDYVYGNDQFEVNYENALGLCYLADYFRNQSLWDVATDFIEEDLSTSLGREHLCHYYTDSVYYDQDEFLDHILGVCSMNLLSMLDEGICCAKLLQELTPHHFLQILGEIETPTEENLSSAIVLSRLITEFCVLHQKELSMETFDHFTSRLTVLNSSSAITLLEASLEYDFGSYKPNSTNPDDENNHSVDSIPSLILFQQQCIGTLSEDWEELLELDQGRVARIMRILAMREEHQSILVDWFQKTLVRASQQLMASRKDTEKAKLGVVQLEARCKSMAKDVEVAKAETNKAQNNHNTTKSEMKTQISSWMRKNEATNQKRQAEQQQWCHERMQWEMERQEWHHHKSRLKRELRVLRQQLAVQSGMSVAGNREYVSDDQHTHFSSSSHSDRNRVVSPEREHQNIHDRPFLLAGEYGTGVNDSASYVTDSSSEHNSLVDIPSDDVNARRNLQRYATNNGMTPQFRIL